ncbi:MAG: hypothetical protein ACP6IP_04845 [Candidatus Njordarchaeia archaeon]
MGAFIIENEEKNNIKVENINASQDYKKKIISFIEQNREVIGRIVKGGHFEIFLVDNLEEFIDREFVDIEKVRIVAHYMVKEEPKFIRAISIFDKIVLEETEYYQVSLPHAIAHSVLLENGDRFHYVENYLALKFFREDIALRLIKFVAGSEMDLAIKLYELFYITIMSALKHISLHELYVKNDLRELLNDEVRFYIELFRELSGGEKWEIIKHLPYAGMLLMEGAIDKTFFEHLNKIGNYIGEIEKIRNALSNIYKQSKVVKPIMGTATYLVRIFFS